MSKTAKKLKHKKIMDRKKAEKARKKALYESLAGTSKKTKRQHSRKSSISGILKHAHAMSNCGNVGCKKCYPLKTLSNMKGT